MNVRGEQQQKNHSKGSKGEHSRNQQRHRSRSRNRQSNNNLRLLTTEGFPNERELENLLSKSPNEILQYLVNPQSGFKAVLKLQSLRGSIVLILQAVCAALQVKNLKMKIKLCIILLQSTLFSEHLPALMNRAKENRSVYVKLQSILVLMIDNILQHSKSLPQNNLQHFVDFSYNFLENVTLEETDPEISKTVASINQTLQQYTQNLSHPVESNERLAKQQIFTDFRSVSIYPTAEDLLNPQQPYLVSIFEKGSYQDLNYYLAVNFRLMREDFISSLRTALQEYLNSRNTKTQTRYENANFYKEVEIKKATSRGELFYKLTVKTNINEDFQQQEILKNGNIICISSDKFKTIHVALIQNFEEDELLKGEGFLQIKCKKTKKSFDKDLEKASYFSALESPALFESYRHVLHCLQMIRKGQLPFEQHIVYADKNIKKPAYMNPNASVTLSTANNSKQVEVPLSDLSSWPPANELKLNISQMKALQLSLSHSLAIIQGPPGTGKTHIGLIILQTLQLNREKWKIDRSPVLIVCYTNHALDQFLEEVLEFNTKLVRVGSRSTSKKLAEFNLKYIRENKLDYVTLLNEITEMRTELEDLNHFLKHKSTHIFHESIFDLPFPDGIILDSMKILNHEYDSKSYLATWLEVAFKTEEIKSLGVMSYFYNQRVSFKEFDKHKGTKINFLQIMHCHFDFPKDLEHTLLYRLKYPCLRKKETAVEEMKKTDEMCDDEVEADMDLWSLSLNDRWRLYRRWITIFTKQAESKIIQLQEEIRHKYNSMKEVANKMDLDTLKSCDVLGMTTTGAARRYEVLKKIGCRIVIIEEAGEILESHTIACLNPNIQHLILIGDHQQLRPKPEDHQLAQNYRLDLSLFERLVNNDLPYVTLEKQHRMRPEISNLIRDEFYPTMKDHPNVCLYPDIRGVLYNVYFINHSSEEEEVMSDSKTYKNDHEAKFLVSFCEYLLHQDYTTNNITILTTYNGQLTAINNLLQKNPELASNLRVSTVDNYQGEENDIILLSLVRSNVSGNVGFLKESNRVNVALSRAKHGLYVIGNLDLLAENVRLWERIVTKMKTKKKFGSSLPIICQTHKTNIRMIAHSQAFEEFAPHGKCQCNEICRKSMPCGHTCQKRCHDGVHDCDNTITRYRECGHQIVEKCTGRLLDLIAGKDDCDQPCGKFLECGHKCVLICHKNSQHKCQQRVIINRLCGHKDIVTCPMKNLNILTNKRNLLSMMSCSALCGRSLICGHSCALNCNHLSLVCDCKEIVNVALICGHTARLPCKADRRSYVCQEIGTVTLICGHTARLPCNADRRSYVCQETKTARLSCGHTARIPCKIDRQSHICQETVTRYLSCGKHTISVKCGQNVSDILCKPCSNKSSKCIVS